jgi:branched-chain amino acid transport system ATP-binding protein
MEPHMAAQQGIARTFQNIALFKGMTVLDNIMTGRNLKMKSQLLPAGAVARPGAARGDGAPQEGRGDHRLPRDPAHPQDPGGRLPYGLQKRVDLAARWPWSRRSCCSTSRWPA